MNKKDQALRLSLTQTRDLCGVAIGTVHRWVDELDLPSEKVGRERTIALSDLLPFLADRFANNPAENRDRLAAAQASRVEFDNNVRQGRYIPIDLHTTLLNAVVSEMVQQLSGLPGRCANELAGVTDAAVVRGKLIDEASRIRNAVSRHLVSIADAIAKTRNASEETATQESA